MGREGLHSLTRATEAVYTLTVICNEV